MITSEQLHALSDQIKVVHSQLSESDLAPHEIEAIRLSKAFGRLYHKLEDLHNTLDGIRDGGE